MCTIDKYALAAISILLLLLAAPNAQAQSKCDIEAFKSANSGSKRIDYHLAILSLVNSSNYYTNSNDFAATFNYFGIPLGGSFSDFEQRRDTYKSIYSKQINSSYNTSWNVSQLDDVGLVAYQKCLQNELRLSKPKTTKIIFQSLVPPHLTDDAAEQVVIRICHYSVNPNVGDLILDLKASSVTGIEEKNVENLGFQEQLNSNGEIPKGSCVISDPVERTPDQALFVRVKVGAETLSNSLPLPPLRSDLIFFSEAELSKMDDHHGSAATMDRYCKNYPLAVTDRLGLCDGAAQHFCQQLGKRDNRKYSRYRYTTQTEGTVLASLTCRWDDIGSKEKVISNENQAPW